MSRPDTNGYEFKGFSIVFDDEKFMKAFNVLNPKAGILKTSKAREALIFDEEKSADFWVKKLGVDTSVVAEI